MNGAGGGKRETSDDDEAGCGGGCCREVDVAMERKELRLGVQLRHTSERAQRRSSF